MLRGRALCSPPPHTDSSGVTSARLQDSRTAGARQPAFRRKGRHADTTFGPYVARMAAASGDTTQGSPDRRRVKNSLRPKGQTPRRSGLPGAAPDQHGDRTLESATIEIPLAASCKEIACQQCRIATAASDTYRGRLACRGVTRRAAPTADSGAFSMMRGANATSIRSCRWSGVVIDLAVPRLAHSRPGTRAAPGSPPLVVFSGRLLDVPEVATSDIQMARTATTMTSANAFGGNGL
jgi:hypothetical protein